MRFKIVENKTNRIGGWCSNFQQANKLKKDFYKIDLKLYGKSNGYIILLNGKENL